MAATLLNINLIKRSEIWQVNLNPTVGAEIKKVRPVVVVSSDGIGRLPIKIVAPITDWQSSFVGAHWIIRIDPDATNGLTKVSGIDTLQVRGVDTKRFILRKGRASSSVMEQVAAAIAMLVEYQ